MTPIGGYLPVNRRPGEDFLPVNFRRGTFSGSLGGDEKWRSLYQDSGVGVHVDTTVLSFSGGYSIVREILFVESKPEYG